MLVEIVVGPAADVGGVLDHLLEVSFGDGRDARILVAVDHFLGHRLNDVNVSPGVVKQRAIVALGIVGGEEILQALVVSGFFAGFAESHHAEGAGADAEGIKGAGDHRVDFGAACFAAGAPGAVGVLEFFEEFYAAID